MKIIYTLLLCFCVSLSISFGQLADGNIAPDFVTTDINGNEIHLYDILDEGKVVILDFFATWCGPCWTYHQTHNLANLYNEYGPEGLDDMYVMTLEVDASTNVDCLYGQMDCNDTTIGDWTIGTPYPIINDNALNNLYKISYFPTIYMVYPNRLIQEIGQLPYDELVALRDDFPTLEAGINPEVLKYNSLNGSVCTGSYALAPYFFVGNMGVDSIFSADISVTENGVIIYEDAWTGMAAPFHPITEIQISPRIIQESKKYELRLDHINGLDESLSFITEATMGTNNAIIVQAQLDGNSSNDNNRYEIIDKDGKVVVSKSLAQDNVYIENSHYLTAGGCFEFILYDNEGDGIDGEITVRDSEGRLIYLNEGFEEEDGSMFNVDVVSDVTNISDDIKVRVQPNPVTEVLHIQIESVLNHEFSLKVIDVAGRMILSQDELKTSNNSYSVDVADWESGMYMMYLTDGVQFVSQKFVKE